MVSSEVTLADRNGMKRLPAWRQSDFTMFAASWLTQSTGNKTRSERLTRPASRFEWFSTPPSWFKESSPQLLHQDAHMGNLVRSATDIKQYDTIQPGGGGSEE